MNYAWAVPGAKVVLVEDRDFRVHLIDGSRHSAAKFGLKLPTLGRVYTIRDVVLNEDGIGVLLVEIDNGHPSKRSASGRELSFRIDRFRPLIERTQEQDVALFAHLLDQKSIQVSEPEVVS